VTSQHIQWITENEKLDLVEGSTPSGAENQRLNILEGSAPSKMEEKPTSSINVRRAGYVGASATPGIMAYHGKERAEKKTFG
jgi:hypothetical protein